MAALLDISDTDTDSDTAPDTTTASRLHQDLSVNQLGQKWIVISLNSRQSLIAYFVPQVFQLLAYIGSVPKVHWDTPAPAAGKMGCLQACCPGHCDQDVY